MNEWSRKACSAHFEPVTRPGLPVLVTVAIACDDEIQLAEAVRF
jgi:hypothetical protein